MFNLFTCLSIELDVASQTPVPEEELKWAILTKCSGYILIYLQQTLLFYPIRISLTKVPYCNILLKVA